MSESIRLKCGVDAEVVPLDGRPGGHLRLSLYAYPHPHHFPITREEAVALARQLLDAAEVPAWEPVFSPQTLRWTSATPSPTNPSKSEPADPPFVTRESARDNSRREYVRLFNVHVENIITGTPANPTPPAAVDPTPPPADPPAPTWRDRPPLL